MTEFRWHTVLYDLDDKVLDIIETTTLDRALAMIKEASYEVHRITMVYMEEVS